MIIHSTLWEAIKIVPLRIFFQVYFKVTPEKVIWSVQVGSVYLTWQSFLQNILLFYLCACPAVTGGGGGRRDRIVPGAKTRKLASHLHYLWASRTWPVYALFCLSNSEVCLMHTFHKSMVLSKWSFMPIEYPLPHCSPVPPGSQECGNSFVFKGNSACTFSPRGVSRVGQGKSPSGSVNEEILSSYAYNDR